MKVKKKVKRVGLIILIVLIVAFLITGGYLAYKKYKELTNGPAQVKIVDEIKEYGYYLEEDVPTGYKKLFYELVKVLKEEEVNEEEYAKLVSSMFLFDFFHLKNKVSKNDIGGTQFILKEYKDNFILEASETIYKYVEINVYGDRKQELPVVAEVEVVNVETGPYNFEDIKDEKAYIVDLKIVYEKDMGYPDEVTVKLVHNNKKLDIFYVK